MNEEKVDGTCPATMNEVKIVSRAVVPPSLHSKDRPTSRL